MANDTTRNVESKSIDEIMSDPGFVKELLDQASAAQQRIERHLNIASQVHRSLLPSQIKHPQIDVDVKYIPLETVGGDYCQVLFPDPSACYITMCEAGGHGVVAALLATRISSEVRHFVRDRLAPVAILRALNAFLYESFASTGLSPSFLATRIDLENRTVSYSGSGQLNALVLNAADGHAQRLDCQNRLLGIEENCLSAEPEHTRILASGDRLVMYSDGLNDMTSPAGETLGQTRVEAIAVESRSVGLFEMADYILDRAAAFRDGRPPEDDVTLIVAEIKQSDTATTEQSAERSSN